MSGKLSSIGIIPSRYGSTRFPGKPLALISGKSMLQRVYEQSIRSNLDKVIVATDDQRIFDHVKDFGGEVVMTSSEIGSGTERCAAAVEMLDTEYEIVLNIQGDEPFINPELLNELLVLFNDHTVQIATPCKLIDSDDDLLNPNIVKVVIDDNHFALYFSRAAIPFIRDLKESDRVNQYNFFAHVGIYAFRTDILAEIVELPSHPLEKAESLEQLRWLANNYTIRLIKTGYQSISVDTPDDLDRINSQIDDLERI
jgi:3-deoxy-manno-octulosonate cytidylyltransferase (CMP-KDO synthetase)